jgi:hypothetical protein
LARETKQTSQLKKVIFIGGTSYSGSTLLDLILANDEHAFSCGEVAALFQPTRTHHINPMCGCGNKACDIWIKAKKRGEKGFIKYLFSADPSLSVIVVSSKHVPWIYEQNKVLKKQGFEVVNVLVWKKPIDFAYSMQKRGKIDRWEKTWINYHKVYFNLIKKFVPVSYEKIIKSDDELKSLCEKIGLRYFSEKPAYWNKTHHTLFGNTTARYHLFSSDSELFQSESREILGKTSYEKTELDKNYKTLYNVGIPEQFKKSFKIQDPKMTTAIAEFLEGSDHLGWLRLPKIQQSKIILGYKIKKIQRKLGLIKLDNFKAL